MEDKLTRQKLINRVNRKAWWRTCLPSKRAIRDRGFFFASSFEEAESYGRPLDTPFRVKIENPIIGSFAYIQKQLLGKTVEYKDTIKAIFAHDKLLKEHARKQGFDSIILLSENGFRKYRKENKLPRQMELNIFSGKECALTSFDLLQKTTFQYFEI